LTASEHREYGTKVAFICYRKTGKDLSKRFPQVCTALKEALPLGTAVDGELVAFDESGHPSFNAIQNASAETKIVFFVFDVIVNRWRDVKHLALSERLLLLLMPLLSASTGKMR
jgi:bifunctional non-homologous end joining protein LigD